MITDQIEPLFSTGRNVGKTETMANYEPWLSVKYFNDNYEATSASGKAWKVDGEWLPISAPRLHDGQVWMPVWWLKQKGLY